MSAHDPVNETTTTAFACREDTSVTARGGRMTGTRAALGRCAYAGFRAKPSTCSAAKQNRSHSSSFRARTSRPFSVRW